MSAHAASPRLTVEKYLSDPDLEKLELVDGVAVETGMGSKKHSVIQLQCGFLLKTYLRSQSARYAATELRCRLVSGAGERFRLPDLCIVEGSREDGDPRYLDGAPLFVVEIRSPENSIAEQLRKLDEYLASGCKLAWLILPEEESVLVRRPGKDVQSFVKGDTLDGEDVLPELRIAVEELFA